MLRRSQYERAASVLRAVASYWREQPDGRSLAKSELELASGLRSDDPWTRTGWEKVNEMRTVVASSEKHAVLAQLERQDLGRCDPRPTRAPRLPAQPQRRIDAKTTPSADPNRSPKLIIEPPRRFAPKRDRVDRNQ